jgi:hypothetical protein
MLMYSSPTCVLSALVRQVQSSYQYFHKSNTITQDTYTFFSGVKSNFAATCDDLELVVARVCPGSNSAFYFVAH